MPGKCSYPSKRESELAFGAADRRAGLEHQDLRPLVDRGPSTVPWRQASSREDTGCRGWKYSSFLADSPY
ncbi:hypothetical protein APTSU1_001793300 [Apodemus speciosus]|uniref:Uncharacterized protein n=1 Tax=Apodemus speciosus TaxID=105296 RepID=A0ABQ0FTW9_APOSI